MGRSWVPRVGAVVLILTLVAAGCSDDDGTTPATTTARPATAPTTTLSPTIVSPSTSTTVGQLTVQVFFLDQNAFNIGRPPYVRPVERVVDAAGPEAAALDVLFEGPTAEESAGGLRFVASEATGAAELRIEEGTAHVYLAGGCDSGGSTFTVADEIIATLVQFTSVDAVKIYDPDGQTGSPDEPGDSIPFCLEP
jgi:hypothetical protein